MWGNFSSSKKLRTSGIMRGLFMLRKLLTRIIWFKLCLLLLEYFHHLVLAKVGKTLTINVSMLLHYCWVSFFSQIIWIFCQSGLRIERRNLLAFLVLLIGHFTRKSDLIWIGMGSRKDSLKMSQGTMTSDQSLSHPPWFQREKKNRKRMEKRKQK